MLQKPKNIYHKEVRELPRVGLDPKIAYEEEQKLSFIKILWYGVTKQELTPKNFRKYENFLLNVKIYGLTAIIALTLCFAVLHSPFVESKYSPEEDPANMKEDFINTALNFIADQWDQLIQNIKTIF